MKPNLLFLTVLSGIAACLFFAVNNGWLLVRLPTTLQHNLLQDVTKKECSVFYWKHNQLHTESIPCLWTDDTALNACTLLQSYCTLLGEEELMPHTVAVQTTAYNTSHSEIFISFSHSPFTQEASIRTKWLALEGFLATLKASFPELLSVRFLMQNAPLQDPHLDASKPWPVEGFLTTEQTAGLIAQQKYPPLTHQKKQCTIMIDPTGDARTPGRILGNTFERALAYDHAVSLKHFLEAHYPQIQVLLSRTPGQTFEFLQRASIANRTNIDLFIHLACCNESVELPTLSVYTYLYHPTTDIWHRSSRGLHFEPYYNAHLSSARASKELAERFCSALVHTKNGSFTFKSVSGLPCKPLEGITHPALCIEIGAQKWHIPALAETLAHSIAHTLNMAP